LLSPRHETVAHALIRGASNRAAGLQAGYRDGPGLPGNISRLRRTPAMRARLAELAAVADEDATVHDRWIIEDLKLFRSATPAWYWKRDARGRLVLRNGKPQIDFSKVTDEQLRCLSEFTVERGGRVKIKVHDPMTAIDRLARHRGLYKDGASVALGVGVNVNQTNGWDLSKLSADELATFESLALKADMSQAANGARGRVIEKIERLIIRSQSGENEE
jgi:hypothetical protein